MSLAARALVAGAMLVIPMSARPEVPADGARPGVVIEHRSPAGLQAPGQIVIDHWGIAHVRAASRRDAFFLQGYNAARDRLWQMDLWRKRGLGRLAASFGPAFAEKDTAARLFLYRGDMAAEWASYPRAAREMTEAFVAGINAWIGEVEAGKAPLPREFAITGSRPERFSADDVVRIRSHTLVSNVASEVQRARAVCAGSLPFENLRRKLEPAHVPVVPKGLDPCDVPADVLRNYTLATGDVSFDGVKLAATPADVQLALDERNDQVEGSNNWVVDGAHSTTGRPILANDPHRAHTMPALRYLVDVSAPGLHFAGAGEPALPGVTFGHNEAAAWGITIFYADQEDLTVYRIRPDRPGAYWYKGKWEPFRIVRETLSVRGEPDREIELQFTRHGPVVARNAARGLAYAVRTVWTLPGSSGYFHASWLLDAQDWADFELAHRHWGTPPLNLVFADVAGDIGWRASAYAPLRKGWDGLMPVPGDGRYEWQGMIAPDDLPMMRNPSRGWVATANQMNLSADWPNAARPVGWEWADRSRIDRIEEVLASRPRHSVADMAALQADVTSPFARRAVAMMAAAGPYAGDAGRAAALFAGWDGREDVDSAPAALFEVWADRHLRAAVAETVAPDKPVLRDVLRAGAATAMVDWLAKAHPGLGPDPAVTRKHILDRSLASAWADLVGRMGPDPAHWRWGELHKALFAPPIAALLPAARRAQWTVGPLEVGGSASTPMAGSFRAGGYDVAAGAAVRMVLDVGAWDNSRVTVMPGQSGDPYSPHYRDSFLRWAAGETAPFLFTRSAVDAHAERIIDLTP
ncbi:MAG: penicillin acylase family protein [Sphingomonadales bacterium]|nr:penicillin acylase family protein [Sphingomonadales bacterium]